MFRNVIINILFEQFIGTYQVKNSVIIQYIADDSLDSL